MSLPRSTYASISRRTFNRGLASLPLLGLASSLAAEETPRPVHLPADPSQGIREGWTIALFPDTQNYAKYGKNQKHFERMCQWVLEQQDAWRIGLVMHEGDFVEQNNIAEGGGRGW